MERTGSIEITRQKLAQRKHSTINQNSTIKEDLKVLILERLDKIVLRSTAILVILVFMFVWYNDGHNKYLRNSRSNKLKIANQLNDSSSETKSYIPTSVL